jgi:predicted AlkP superfamily pyrophosphatase or phosphodiesterase
MMRKTFFLSFLLATTVFFVTAQSVKRSGAKMATQQQSMKPKLVVGLVIDQMRWDYLYRFNQLYTANGFKRLIGEGFSCDNTLIPYTPTYTAPGHTCIYTGSVPAIHGIVGNNWYDKTLNADVYCTDDSTVSTVGNNR